MENLKRKRAVLALSTVTVVATCGFGWSGVQGWQAFRADARGSGSSGTEPRLPVRLWRTFENPLGWMPAVVAQGVLYLTGGDHAVKAFSPILGEHLWTFQTGANIGAPPVYDEEKLYVASQDHWLYALDATTGKALWRLDLGSDGVAPPLVQQGTLFAGSERGELVVVDTATGEVRWRRDFAAAVVAIAADGASVYIGVDDHRVCALDMADGRALWEAELADNPAPAVTVVDGKVYAADLLGGLLCMDARAGDLLWRAAIRLMCGSVPAVAGDHVFVTTENGDAAALAADDGRLVRQAELTRPARSSPAAGPAFVYYAQGGCQFSALPRQTEQWPEPPAEPVSSASRPPRRPVPKEAHDHVALSADMVVITAGSRCLVMPSRRPMGGKAGAGAAVPFSWPVGKLPDHPTAVLDLYPLLADGSALPRTNPPPPWKYLEVGDHTLVALDATMSWDAYGHPLIMYQWTEPLGDAPFVRRPFGIGGHDVYLHVWDEEMLRSWGPASHRFLVDPIPETRTLLENQRDQLRRLRRQGR